MPTEKHRNHNIKYVKSLFESIPKAKGKLMAISNGGYSHKRFYVPDFGYRIYFDAKENIFHCQVISEINEKYNSERLREYSVTPTEETTVASLENAILYNEYRIRTWDNMQTKKI